MEVAADLDDVRAAFDFGMFSRAKYIRAYSIESGDQTDRHGGGVTRHIGGEQRERFFNHSLQ